MPYLSSWDRGNTASLFDRIRGEGHGSSPRSEVEVLVDSVKRQLDQILNTRPGNCRSAPDLGVIDLNDATQGSADIKGRIREAIRQCIRRYEPRIVHVDVRSPDYQSSPLEMSFMVTAHVRLEHIDHVTSFNVHMDSHRHYRMV
ncbi:type VI secretion system baseplate subunit TssE [Aeromonas jandaei]|jgi:type VI secretion system protein|uniref:Type VI secretion system baseplate subunit TssE n=1 Tax=Aeromonas jandaei TaxID=650 RepID=A0ABD7ENU5_AERJA|nr:MULTISPECIES: type VI secretion system baseplate subunit TssE [Aeromonas]KIQ77842.1 lysozyme [Aeromonas sp. L_1B5_3]MBL0543615.1 type VI secretion system baseplate subunit TssE [Aeromonas jandaei]MBL0597573.1 type VI secretion system baseplate subunit TssE [Aeromonas jandaei]MBL0612890.1 type VI secretion system baseplate subunit TssE [Aeromonas jandaei]MBL0668932.1 type VI secretion system baseplate subunit TssE [Aeromonas jandaei]